MSECIFLPLVMLDLIIYWAHIWAPWLGTSYLLVFEGWAQFIGAPVTVGPTFPDVIAL